jgi:RNA polymerase sigma factor (TIGR02999 family)
LLLEWRNGNNEAAEKFLNVVYDELRRLSAIYLRRERSDHTLQPTALVNELYLRLFTGAEPVSWNNRAHFFAVAAQTLRRILVDHARARRADKRGGEQIKLALADVQGWAAASPNDQDLIEVDEALRRLEQLEPRAAQVVELRFFGGLLENEVAEVLGVAPSTVKRDWRFARAWLTSQLRSSGAV